MLSTITNYQDRIHAGKQIEHSILNALRGKGYKIQDPTSNEDMYDKIDGWWIDVKGNKYSVQIKYRESGTDILFELVKDIDKKIQGRDMLSKASLYLVATKFGDVKLFTTKPIKDECQKILNMINKALDINPKETNWSGSGWEAKLQIDRAHGQRKLIAYLSPNHFKPLAMWNLNF